MAERTKITALDNGPLLVKGPVLLLDAEGDEFRAERATVALCRCGGSTTKPFCDGTHSRLGFRAAERAVPEKGERDWETSDENGLNLWLLVYGKRTVEHKKTDEEEDARWRYARTRRYSG